MSEQAKDKDRDTPKSRRVEVPNQEALLSNLSRVHKAGDLSQEVILQETEQERTADTEEPAEETATAGNTPPSAPQRRKKSAPADESGYKSAFLKRYEADSRRNVYISGELHKTVSDIVAAVKIIDGKNITVGGYIDNVLTEHFETHREEINSLYRIGKNDLVK